MYKGLLVAGCISLLAVAAFANDPLPYLTGPAIGPGGGGNGNTDDVLVDNLATAVAQLQVGLSGCAYPAHDSWVAFDYTPATTLTAVAVNKLSFHYLYYTSVLKSTLNFRLYEGADPGVGSIVSSWNVATSGYNEINTGWTFGGRVVYRVEVPIPDQTLTAKTKYWFAYRSSTTALANIVYWLCRRDSIKEEMVWWYLNASWGSSQTKGQGILEQSYKIEGSVIPGIAPTSFGKIKTLYH